MDERSLRGATVALFEARQSCDLARLVTRHGGIPWLAPAVIDTPFAGATVRELELYPWDLAENQRIRLADTIEAIIGGRIDVALFTSEVQVHRLLVVADRMWLRRRLVRAVRRRVRVGAVGPTCAAALRSAAIEPVIEVEHPMGHFVTAVAREWAAEAHPRPAIAAHHG